MLVPIQEPSTITTFSDFVPWISPSAESRNAGSTPSAVGTTWSHPTEYSLEVQPSQDGLTGMNVQNSKRQLVATVSAP